MPHRTVRLIQATLLLFLPLAICPAMAARPALQGKPAAAGAPLRERALAALKRGIAYFHSISIQGGYVYYYSANLKEKWGEGRTDDWTVEVQPPGTPAVGMAILRAFQATGERDFLSAARDAGKALIAGQNELGGWEHTINFRKGPARTVSFDDNQTQSALRFLMALDKAAEDAPLRQAVDRGLGMMLRSQFENGAWPHKFPKQGNYHDFATYNDRGINDCINVMLDAHRNYGKEEYLRSLHKAAGFLLLSQLPPPQPGWAQQYNQYLQPAWARSFEPPAVCSGVTLNNINSLIDLFLYTGDQTYLEPIPDALRWLTEARLPNGKWPRFAELGTNRPLYYDRGRIRVESVDRLHIERMLGYGYEQDLGGALEKATTRFNRVMILGKEGFLQESNRPLSREQKIEKSRALEAAVTEILSGQDDQGRWVTRQDKYKKIDPGRRWNGEYEVQDRISSASFISNVNLLCDYLQLQKPQ